MKVSLKWSYLLKVERVGERAVNMCARAWSLQTTCTIWCNWKEISRNTFEAGYMMSMMSTNKWILHFKGCPLNNTQFLRYLCIDHASSPCLGRFGTKWPKYSEVMGFQSTMGSPKKADRPTTKKPKETSGRQRRFQGRKASKGVGLFWGWGSKIVAWRRFIWIICFVFLQLCFLTVGACKDKKTIRLLGQTMYTLYNTYGIYILILFLSVPWRWKATSQHEPSH